jgi:hypothetical protein
VSLVRALNSKIESAHTVLLGFGIYPVSYHVAEWPARSSRQIELLARRTSMLPGVKGWLDERAEVPLAEVSRDHSLDHWAVVGPAVTVGI